ncbi:MAG: hypothetical protein ACLFVU_14955 [Phycisphaerae bacterium]
MKRSAASIAITAAWFLLLSGCSQPEQKVVHPEVNYELSSPYELVRVNSVALIELAADHQSAGRVESMTEAVYEAVQSRRIFQIDVIRRDDPICRDLPLGGSEPLTMEQLDQIRRTLKVDAVLVGSVHHFRPHPHMQTGLTLRLLDLRRGKLIWGVDDVWDSSTEHTEKRIQAYFREKVRSGYGPVDYKLVMMSPIKFEEFVAYEVSTTLPRRGGVGR